MKYRIAILKHYYHGSLGVNNAPRIAEEIFETIEATQATIDELENEVYTLDHNESERPDYYVIDANSADYIIDGRDGDFSNYNWDNANCDCGNCDDCFAMMADQDREFVKMIANDCLDLEEPVNLEEILENMKAGKYSDRELSSLPSCGQEPPVESSWPWWAYDGTRAIIGESSEEFEIVDYSYFRNLADDASIINYKEYQLVKTSWTTGTPAQAVYEIWDSNNDVIVDYVAHATLAECKEYIDIVLA